MTREGGGGGRCSSPGTGAPDAHCVPCRMAWCRRAAPLRAALGRRIPSLFFFYACLLWACFLRLFIAFSLCICFFFSLSIVLCLGLCLYVRFFVAASMSSNAYYVAACVVDSRATDAGKRQGQLRREESERPREAGGGVQPGVGMGGAHPTMRKVQRLVPPTFFAHQCVPQVISSGGALPEGES